MTKDYATSGNKGKYFKEKCAHIGYNIKLVAATFITCKRWAYPKTQMNSPPHISLLNNWGLWTHPGFFGVNYLSCPTIHRKASHQLNFVSIALLQSLHSNWLAHSLLWEGIFRGKAEPCCNFIHLEGVWKGMKMIRNSLSLFPESITIADQVGRYCAGLRVGLRDLWQGNRAVSAQWREFFIYLGIVIDQD